jgi:hypothetical protein
MSNTGYMLYICYNRIMEITTTKELLVENLIKYFNADFLKSLEEVELDQDEKDANIILSRKKIKADAEGLATIVFKSFE